MTDNTSTPVPALDPTSWLAQEQARARHYESIRPENKAALFEALAQVDITTVLVEFDGYGDSGQIQDIGAHAGPNVAVNLPECNIDIAHVEYGSPEIEAARAAQDELQKHYRAITDGAKELRIDRERRRRVHDNKIGDTIDRIRDMKISAMRIFMTANALDGALFFAVVGLIIGAQGVFGIDRTVVSGFVLILLYMKGPLDQVVSAYGSFVNAQISFRRVAQLSIQFEGFEPHLLDARSESDPDVRRQDVESIELRNVTYAFPPVDDNSAFVLGQIDLTIRKGDILFIVGENGCGKTTLIKLILGLYAPQYGQVLLNNEPVTERNRDAYRQHFSAVFFDYFLFDDLVMPEGTSQATIQTYLEKLEIAHKVTITDGVFSTTDLSAGQRKRLALIQVYLEGRPVIVFDEWAAEQDPTFRRIFYTELVPDLRRQGKTLIVISHDDRYFGAADRIVRLERGRIVDVGVPTAVIPLRARGAL